MTALLLALRNRSSGLRGRTLSLSLGLLLKDPKRCGLKIQANEVIDSDGDLLTVLKSTHSTGRGRQLGNVQMEVKEVQTGRKRSFRFRPSDTLEVAQLRSTEYQILYTDGEEVHLMNNKHFTQIAVGRALFGDQGKWLLEGMQVTVTVLSDGQPVSGKIPQMVTLRVTEAAAYAKGDRVSPSTKPCVLENGATLLTPAYVQAGELVLVDTRNGEFVKRAS